MNWWQRVALVWLAVALACAAFVGLRFAQGSPVESDLLALLPATERNPRAEAAVAALSQRLGNRAVLLVGHGDPGRARALARDFAGRLRDSGAFTRILAEAPKFDARLVTDTYGPYRAGLLGPADREQLAAGVFNAEATLLRRLHAPFRTGIPTDPALDPFGFLQRWLAGLPLAQTRLGSEDGMLVARDGAMAYVLILAEPGGSAFDPGTQERVAAAVGAAEAALKAAAPDAVLLRTGGIFYGEAARRSAQGEMDLIGGGSLLGILAMLWLLFRSLRPLAFGLATVALGIACGAAAVLAADGRIHLITLVFGASLIGEAIDYAIQYFAAQLDAGKDWQPRAGLRRILPGLAVALATSLIGYGALSLAPFPAIRQIALFAFVGLAAAWLSVVILLPLALVRPSSRNVAQAVAWPRRFLEAWRRRATVPGVLALAAAILALSVPGWLLLGADDDVRLLVARPAQLVEEEKLIRRLAGVSGSGRFFLVEGESSEEALAREEALTARLRPLVGQGIGGFSAISAFVPSRASQEGNRELLSRALPAAATARVLADQGFLDAAAANWQAAAGETLSLEKWLESPLAMAVKHQILATGEGGTALMVTLDGDDGSVDLKALAAGLPAVTVVDKAGSVSALFAEYRSLAVRWLPLAMAIVLAILAARYGWRKGLAVLVPTLLAMGAAMALYGYAGVPVTLFTAMGLVLVLGVGVNYAIFVVEAGDRAPAPFAGVLLSAATTILSFGLLSLSSMPALHQFGLVLLAGVSASVLLAPLALTLGNKPPCA